jgi:hypothetical protein
VGKYLCSHSQLNGGKVHVFEAPMPADAAVAFVRKFGQPRTNYHVMVNSEDGTMITVWVLINIQKDWR